MRPYLSFLAFAFSLPMLGQQLTHGRPVHLPAPFSTTVKAYPAKPVAPPRGWRPKPLPGFKVTRFAGGLRNPRWLAVAPNGDVYVAETGPGRVLYFSPQGQAKSPAKVFAEGLKRPFGLAFHGSQLYVGDTDEVLRFGYDARTGARTSGPKPVLALPAGGAHFTRSVAFSRDGRHLFISVGSSSNIGIPHDHRRAAVLETSPEGGHWRVYAFGLRNPAGLGVNPATGQVWVAVNERDMLGDALPPDYFTHLKPGGFYGWPYSYIGQHVDPRVKPQRPELVKRAIVPDVLLGSHVAPLQFAFYSGTAFPAQYRGGAFLAEHGSWNSSVLHGYQVVFIPFRHGQASRPPKTFLAGFAKSRSAGEAYGRPVGIAVAKDGSLLVSDDLGGVIWRVTRK